MRLCIIAAVTAMLSCHAAAHASPAAILRACAGHATADAVGFEALAAHCPGLADALGDLDLSSTLSRDWRKTLTAQALTDLATLGERYQAAAPSGLLDRRPVRAILDGLAREHARAPQSWWSSLLEWLRSWFAHRDAHSLSWLSHALQRLADSGATRIIVQGCLILIALFALAWIFGALRAADIFKRRERTATSPQRAIAPPLAVPADDAAWEEAPPAERPALLLKRIVHQLCHSGLLAGDRPLTHRELVQRARLEEDQRTRFAAVSAMAERIRYGRAVQTADAAPVQGHLASALEAGRTLLEELSDAPRQTQ